MKTVNINIAGTENTKHISTANDKIVDIVFAIKHVSYSTQPAMSVSTP